jgi:hypothetical protein
LKPKAENFVGSTKEGNLENIQNEENDSICESDDVLLDVLRCVLCAGIRTFTIYKLFII